MRGYLYFPNNSRHKRPYVGLYDNLQNRFQIFQRKPKLLMVTIFKENLNLQLLRIFYSSVIFISETEFILKQIAENRFGAL